MERDPSDDEIEFGKSTGRYTVSVYSSDARLLSHYAMQADADKIESMVVAENRVRDKLETCQYEDVLAVVTQETDKGFNQTQMRVDSARVRALCVPGKSR